MSNNPTLQKTKSERRSNENPSSRDSTQSPDGNSSDSAVLKALLEALKPALDMVHTQAEFHKELKSARESDIRILWDVRIISGASTPVAHLAGSSHMPGALSVKMRHSAAAAIQQEILEKIAMPASGSIMELEERLSDRAVTEVAAITSETTTSSNPPRALSSPGFGDIQQLAIAAQKQEMTEVPVEPEVTHESV